MNILSIDQSLNHSGYTIFKDDEYKFDVIKPSKKYTTLEKLVFIRDTVDKIIKKNKIELVIREGFSYHSKDSRSVFELGAIGWIILICAYDNKIKYYICPPFVHQKFTTGRGNCSKSLMLLHCFKKYKYELNDDNIADSLSMLKCYQGYQKYLKGDDNFKKYEKDVFNKMMQE